LSADDAAAVAAQVKLYKEIRETIQFGRFYRIESPFEGNTAAWNFVDGKRAVLFYFKGLSEAGSAVPVVRMKGLQPDAQYRNADSGECFYGDELMQDGIAIPLNTWDFTSYRYLFEVVNDDALE
jgi:alpha-galactosidase